MIKMKRSTRKITPQTESLPSQWLIYRPLGAILLVAVIFISTAILFWSPQDPSLNTATADIILNPTGYWGAAIADIMVQSLGYAAFIIPLIALVWAFLLLRGRVLHDFGLRFIALIMATLTTAFLLAFDYFGPLHAGLNIGTGGAGGRILHDFIFTGLKTLSADPASIDPIAMAVGLIIALFFALYASTLILSGYPPRLLLARSSSKETNDVAELTADMIADKADAQPQPKTSSHKRLAPRRFTAIRRWPMRLSAFFYQQLKTPTNRTIPPAPSTADHHATNPAFDPETTKPQQAAPSTTAKPTIHPLRDDLPRLTPDVDILGDDELPPDSSGFDDKLPKLSLLTAANERNNAANKLDRAEEISHTTQALEQVLRDFGVKGSILANHPGPVVTLYEFEPAPGIKSSRIIGLAEDIARSMRSVSARIAIIPGHNALGIELPNAHREPVMLRELLANPDYTRSSARLPLALGKNIAGTPVIMDLAQMPHLLIAGTTGSGKSVSVNAMILSLLYRLPAQQCKLLMIDPKMLELSVYNDIPNLCCPVITDPQKAVRALKWAVREMENRYRNMSRLGVRNIESYNRRAAEVRDNDKPLTRSVQTGFDTLTGQPIFETEQIDITAIPYIVVIIDEVADLMMIAGKEIEIVVQRLAQMARAAGIHLIAATQRPSVDVITGTIKANFPTRISFHVISKIDSRTILGDQGAEQLLGRGDMLCMTGGARINRIHGPFVSDQEVENVADALRRQGPPNYDYEITEASNDEAQDKTASPNGDDLYQQAFDLLMRDGKASISYLQRRLSIGYNRAASLMEQLEEKGIVSPADHAGRREIYNRDNL